MLSLFLFRQNAVFSQKQACIFSFATCRILSFLHIYSTLTNAFFPLTFTDVISHKRANLELETYSPETSTKVVAVFFFFFMVDFAMVLYLTLNFWSFFSCGFGDYLKASKVTVLLILICPSILDIWRMFHVHAHAWIHSIFWRFWKNSLKIVSSSNENWKF